jgi:hypothetical protein
MALDAHDPGGLDIDLLAAALRADTSELGTFVEALAVKLEEAVPGSVRVERRREGMFGPKLVRRITLDTDQERLELSRDRDRVETSSSRLSGGIVLKREMFPTDAWLQRLGGALAEQAARSQSTRQALERLLNE